MKKILFGIFLGSGIMFGSFALAGIEFVPNPLFDVLPVDLETGKELTPYTQSQKDLSMLYGKLEGLSIQIQNLALVVDEIFKVCVKR